MSSWSILQNWMIPKMGLPVPTSTRSCLHSTPPTVFYIPLIPRVEAHRSLEYVVCSAKGCGALRCSRLLQRRCWLWRSARGGISKGGQAISQRNKKESRVKPTPGKGPQRAEERGQRGRLRQPQQQLQQQQQHRRQVEGWVVQ